MEKRTKPARKTKRYTGRRVAEEMIEAMTELVESLESGEPLTRRFTVRTVERLPTPSAYDVKKIKATRELLGASQMIFAQLVGVSLDQAQSWEMGRRQPSATVRRLFDEIHRDPWHWRAIITGQEAMAG